LRPLWRSYTRCTDGIIFVIDSVDLERMEEAKMELMRTAKCPDNQVRSSSPSPVPAILTSASTVFQGTPLLILANKQDLPMAKEPKELEKLLGLQELLSPIALSVSSGTLSSIDGSGLPEKSIASSSSSSIAASKNSDQNSLKSWHIQPTCAITGEGNFYSNQLQLR
jgi:signal recognition particle receptor subunit beta